MDADTVLGLAGSGLVSDSPDVTTGTPNGPAPVRDAIDALDDTLDRALGTAATSLWSLAARVQSAVPAETQAALVEQAQRAKAINFTSVAEAARDVVGTVQRNAVRVEEALLDAASAARMGGEAAGGEDGNQDREGREGTGEDGGGGEDEAAVARAGVHVAKPHGGYVPEDLDVNAELARAARTLQNSVGSLQASVVGKTVGGLFGSLSLWAAGDDAGDESDEYGDGDGARDAPQTRFQGLVRDLEVNPDTYCMPAADQDGFGAWARDFNLDRLEADCVDLLDRHPSVTELYERVVPRVLEEETFWMRYFYARHMLDVRERERIALLQRAVGGAEEDADAAAGWDDDDDDAWDDAKQESTGGGAAGNGPDDKAAETGVTAAAPGEEGVDAPLVDGGGADQTPPLAAVVADGVGVPTAADAATPAAPAALSSGASPQVAGGDRASDVREPGTAPSLDGKQPPPPLPAADGDGSSDDWE
jgi:hypothetical protein